MPEARWSGRNSLNARAICWARVQLETRDERKGFIVKLTSTTHSSVEASRPARELMPARDQLAPEFRYPNSPQGRDLQGIEADILRAMWAEDSPLTLRLLHQKTGIPVEHLTAAMGGLNSAGHIRRV